jgi:hypothetical protein
VARGTARAAAWRNCSRDIRPIHWRAPAQSRYHHTHGGLTPAALVSGESLPACAWRFLLHARSRNHGGLTPAALASECERLPAKLRLLRRTNAHAQERGRQPPVAHGTAPARECDFCHGRTRVHQERGGRQPPVVRGTAPARECDFCDARTHVHQERGASAPRGPRNRTCSGVAQLFGRHPPHTLASASAVTVPPHPRRAHARRSCVGMRTFVCEIATFAMHERTCTGAGGVSPPWFTVTQLQRRGAIVRGTSDPYTGERQRSYGTTTPTAGSRPPLLRWANRCLLVRGDFFCTRVLGTTAG